MDYLNEPIIRKHMFGRLQIFIGTVIGWYFMFRADDTLTLLLIGFMIISFLLGHMKTNKASDVMAIYLFFNYLMRKNKENKTTEDEEMIKNFEDTPTYRLLRESGMEI